MPARRSQATANVYARLMCMQERVEPFQITGGAARLTGILAASAHILRQAEGSSISRSKQKNFEVSSSLGGGSPARLRFLPA